MPHSEITQGISRIQEECVGHEEERKLRDAPASIVCKLLEPDVDVVDAFRVFMKTFLSALEVGLWLANHLLNLPSDSQMNHILYFQSNPRSSQSFWFSTLCPYV